MSTKKALCRASWTKDPYMFDYNFMINFIKVFLYSIESKIVLLPEADLLMFLEKFKNTLLMRFQCLE